MDMSAETTNMTFNTEWNSAYDFSNAENLAVIQAVERYSLKDDLATYEAGEQINSPWGSNQVLEISENEQGQEICTKEIIVNPKQMLSLQRHRGRAEKWAVQHGTLTVILDGQRHDVEAGDSIEIPLGSVHCMINLTNKAVSVIETQTGICREKDNIRLCDLTGRATYPLTTELEYNSVKIYQDIAREIRKD